MKAIYARLDLKFLDLSQTLKVRPSNRSVHVIFFCNGFFPTNFLFILIFLFLIHPIIQMVKQSIHMLIYTGKIIKKSESMLALVCWLAQYLKSSIESNHQSINAQLLTLLRKLFMCLKVFTFGLLTC